LSWLAPLPVPALTGFDIAIVTRAEGEEGDSLGKNVRIANRQLPVCFFVFTA
jgi:hypothetical protein